MNPVERKASEFLRDADWKVYRHGWPDFLCVRSNDGNVETMAVEVKLNADPIRKAQAAVHQALEQAGIPVQVVRFKRLDTDMRPDDLTCAAGDCKKKFSPRIRTQIYCSRRCRNRAAQQRYDVRQRTAEYLGDPLRDVRENKQGVAQGLR